MPAIFERNHALDTNPPAGHQHLSENGSDWLWTVTAIYGFSFLSFFALSFFARAGEKIFHYLFTIALLVGTIGWYAMAADLAFVVVEPAEHVSRGDRQIFWAKYVNWVVEFPVIILALGIPSGVSWATLVYQTALSWVWVVSYLVGAFTRTNYKWGFFAFGTVAWLFLAFSTLRDGSIGARRFDIGRDFFTLAGWVNLLWLLYPIAWGVSDGGNRIGVTPSFIFFGILDVLLIPLTAFAFLAFARRWDYGRLNLAFTQYGRVNSQQGTFPEKQAVSGAAGGVTGTVPPAASEPVA
ncbi:hypothetical protein VTK73DRAFT_10074 [Phialemonium thermophilum]|uniref:Bacteriorhodopsin n=1 Tax=Phialemonium thermophilum TaxID=223376 RepID=A0ABR3XI66_9PEZI